MAASEDPVTVIGLIYRIVDEPRRAFTFALILPVLAGWPAPAIWWSGTGVLGLSWLTRAVILPPLRSAGRLRVNDETHEQPGAPAT